MLAWRLLSASDDPVAVSTTNLQVDLSADLARLVDPTGSDVAARVRETLVLALFRDGVISSGRSAELLGISKDQFLDLLGERDIPYLDQTYEEILEDARVAASARPQGCLAATGRRTIAT